MAGLIGDVKTLNSLIELWVRWCHEGGALVAGYPSRSTTEAIRELKLTGTDDKAVTARVSGSRSVRIERYEWGSHPAEELMHRAVAEMAVDCPKLYDAFVAEHLGLVPVKARAQMGIIKIQHVGRRNGEPETVYRARLAIRLGMSERRFREMLQDARLFLGCWLSGYKNGRLTAATD